MAIGDNWNDVEMLRWAGQPVLMGNASPDLLHRAARDGWAIAPTNDEDGAACTVEQALARPPRTAPIPARVASRLGEECTRA